MNNRTLKQLEEEREAERQEKERKADQINSGLLVIVIILTLAIAAALGWKMGKRFASETLISGVDCGKLEAEQAMLEIENAEVKIQFLGDKGYTVTGKELGRSMTGSSELEYFLSQQKAGQGSNLREFTLSDTSFKVDTSKTESYLASLPELDESSMTESQDAYLAKTEDFHVQIIPEIYGNRIAFDEALAFAYESLKSGSNLIDFEAIISRPKVKQDAPNLVSKAQEINTAVDTAVIYELSDGSVKILDSYIIGTWIEEDESGEIIFDLSSHVQEFVKELSKVVEELGAYATVTTKRGTFTLPVEGGFRNKVDEEAEVSMLLEELKRGGVYERMPCYSRYNDFSNLENYVEVAILKQEVEMYRDGKNCFDTPYVPTISGQKGVYDSPTGIFFATFKASPYTMRKYGVSEVDTWITISGNVGFHDASGWRSDSEYTPKRYIKKGSHGCFNLMKKHSRVIYDNILLDVDSPEENVGERGFMPIIIHE